MDQLEKSAGPHSDALARFLRSATDRPLNSPAWALAEALGRTFHPSDVVVRWEIIWHAEKPAAPPPWAVSVVSCEAQWSVCKGVARDEEGPEANDLEWTETKHYAPFEITKGASRQAQGLRIGRISPSTGARSNLEIIFLRPDDSFPVDRIKGFCHNFVGITTLYQAFAALQAARLTAPRRATAGDFVAYIAECSIAMDYFAVFPGMVAPQEQIVEDLALAMFGHGWDIDKPFGSRGFQALKGFVRQLGDLAAKNPRVRQLQAILAASLGMKPHRDRKTKDSSGDLQIIDLIARWTYLHARAREVLRLGASQRDWTQRENEFRKEASLCSSSLVGLLLRKQSSQPDKPIERAFLSSWLQFWFCQALLEELATADSRFFAAPSAIRWRFFADLAYVIREILREMVYGNRPEFKLYTVTFTTALCTLVEQHALRILQIPQSLDVGGLLREIGHISLGGNPFFAANHLLHVVEIYMVGLFLIDTVLINVQAAGLNAEFEGTTIGEVLAGAGAWRPGQFKQQEFRSAFALAALLHHIGMLLFPHWPRRAEGLAEVDAGLRKNLKGIRDVLNVNVQQLLTTCERELGEADIYDPLKESRIKAWIEERVEHGETEDSLLGAWYLVRIARNVSGLSVTTLQQAARAILLHAIPTREIRAEEDPVTALLVLCDELVAWRDGHEPPPQAKEEGRTFLPTARELLQEHSIFHTLRVPGLRVSLRKNQKDLFCSLDLAENLKRSSLPSTGRAISTWPHLELKLKSHNQLPVPIYQLWLLVSQNLGRIESFQSHWGPVLHIRSEVPARQPPIGTHELLGRIVHRAGFRLRPCLQRWLELYQPPGKEKTSGFESVSLGPSDAFYDGRMELLFPELERLVDIALHEEDLRHQKSPAKPRSDSHRSAKKRNRGTL